LQRTRVQDDQGSLAELMVTIANLPALKNAKNVDAKCNKSLLRDSALWVGEISQLEPLREET